MGALVIGFDPGLTTGGVSMLLGVCQQHKFFHRDLFSQASCLVDCLGWLGHRYKLVFWISQGWIDDDLTFLLSFLILF